MKKAFELTACDLEKEEEDHTIIALRAMNQTKEDHGTWRAHDIVAEMNSNDAESLRKTITWKIRKLSSVRSSLYIMATEEQR